VLLFSNNKKNEMEALMFSPARILRDFGDVLGDPYSVRLIVWLYILAYYGVSLAYIWGNRHQKLTGILKRNGIVDILTSVLWIVFGVMLIWSLLAITLQGNLTLGILAQYYLFFIFLFAFLYGLIEWHWPGKLTNVSAEGYEAELQYFLMSVGAQTTFGYARARPNHWVTETLAAAQSLLGVAFIAVWVALAVGRSGR
jgi:hypothetical protein